MTVQNVKGPYTIACAALATFLTAASVGAQPAAPTPPEQPAAPIAPTPPATTPAVAPSAPAPLAASPQTMGKNAATVVAAATEAKEEAEAKAEKQETRADKAEDKAKDKESQIDHLKTGTLVAKWGLTGGAAMLGQLNLLGDSQLDSSELPLKATPYILWIPAYTFSSDALSHYCASQFLDGSRGAAAVAADKEASKKARRVMTSLLSAVAAGADVQKQLEELLIETAGKSSPIKASKVKTWATSYGKADSQDEREKIVKKHSAAIQHLYWNTVQGGKCGWSRLGVWVGLPPDFKADTLLQEHGAAEATHATREVDSQLAVGLAWAPNSYIAILGGVTWGKVKRASPAAGTQVTQRNQENVFALSVGLGGNLDTLGFLAK